MKKRRTVLMLTAWAIALNPVSISSTIAQSAGPSVDDMVRSLKPPPVRTRGLGRSLMVEPAQIDLTVEFDFNSARLRAESQPILGRLASAMKSDGLRGLRFRIEGHTDAVGSLDYNMKLSNRRAQTVGNFLVVQGVDQARLESVGKGASEPIVQTDPLAAANRRVRIVTIEQGN
jgi:outer membrane protein OmpA-like peptidoglycan-associated protein